MLIQVVTVGGTPKVSSLSIFDDILSIDVVVDKQLTHFWRSNLIRPLICLITLLVLAGDLPVVRMTLSLFPHPKP